MFHRGPSAPRGWELAPSTVEQEVITLWQEEDMPAELKDAPGYVPFTVSAETQEWIDSMVEVREIIQGKDRHVAGRPRPMQPEQLHHIRSVPTPAPAPAPPPTPPIYSSPAGSSTGREPREAPVPQPRPEPRPEPVAPPMPEIVLGRSLTLSRPRHVPAPPPKDEGPVMPDIGGGGASRRAQQDDQILMPDIDT